MSFGMRFFCIVLSAQHSAFSGDGYVAPPVPIPNTAVKHIHAESTWLGTAREDRESLIYSLAYARLFLVHVFTTFLLVKKKYGRFSEIPERQTGKTNVFV